MSPGNNFATLLQSYFTRRLIQQQKASRLARLRIQKSSLWSLLLHPATL